MKSDFKMEVKEIMENMEIKFKFYNSNCKEKKGLNIIERDKKKQI